MRNKRGASGGWVALIVILAIVLLASGALNFGSTPSGNVAQTQPSNTVNNPSGVCPYQPTAGYSTKDKFGTATVTGTSYYKTNGNPATTTAASNVQKGITYEYWVSNATYYVKPAVFSADCGVNTVIAEAINNASVSLSLYDTTNSKALWSNNSGSSGGNTTLGANGVANIRITFQGTAKKGMMPFGGVMVAEYNNTITSVTCTGANIVPNSYHVTYGVEDVQNTFQLFGISGIDDGTGNAKTIDCQFKNGASQMPTISRYRFIFIPANYYLTNDGSYDLDTEQFKNQLTTRTGIANATILGIWA